MTVTGFDERRYRLTDRSAGTALFGLAMPQVVVSAAGLVALVLLPVTTHSVVGFLLGLGVAAGCGLFGFFPVGGRPVYQVAGEVAGFAAIRASGQDRWRAPLPLLTGASAGRPSGAGGWPLCLAGLEVLAHPRPGWAGGDRTLAAVGLVRDRRTRLLTVVLPARGGPFTLEESSLQHARLAGWSGMLAQFARESSPVVRLGWTLRSASAPHAEHLHWLERNGHHHPSAGVSRAEADYRRLLHADGATALRHELRLWVSIDPARLGRRHADPVEAALAAAKALTDRAAAAGMMLGPPASPVQLAETLRAHADPTAVARLQRISRGLAEHAGLAPVAPVHARPLAMNAEWDAVRIDAVWHRVFWVAQWPTHALQARWLEPLVLAPPCPRVLTVVLEPVGLRASRRRINAEAVSVTSQVQLRERHALRVPVGLAQAQAGIDDRESELAAGHAEYAYLTLLAVTGADREELDANTAAVADQAAQCGVTELRPVYGRQDAAWAATLPFGRVPRRGLWGGGSW